MYRTAPPVYVRAGVYASGRARKRLLVSVREYVRVCVLLSVVC